MKKILLGTTLAVFTAMTLTAGIASARGHGGQCRPEISFEMLDTDGNGGITAAEMSAKAMEKFTAGDTDNDGYLSAEEVLAAGQARMAEHQANEGSENSERAGRRTERAEHMIEHLFERQDANDDGLLSPEEMKPRHAEERFVEADTDENGEISEAEFDGFKESHSGRRGKGPRECNDG